jgi:hypothetical protein
MVRRFTVSLALLLAAAAGETGAGEGESRSLQLMVRDSFLPGIPLFVRVELRDGDGGLARDVWDAEATLEASAATLTPDRITLRNGVGSALVAADATEDFTLTAKAIGLEASRALTSLADAPQASIAGDLPGDETEWSGVVHVTADVTVPSGHTLTVAAGTLVLIDGVESGEDGADINVEGTLKSLGTAERPVTFTAFDPSRPWGEIDHDGADDSLYQYTIVTLAGHSPRGGHTGTGPAVRPHGGSRIVFESCSFSDNAGKVMQASSSDLTFRDCLLARSVMGPEIAGTALLFEGGSIVEMFGRGDDGDDGDGIYIHDQQSGQEVTIRGAMVAATTDDGIDTLSSEVVIEDTIVRDMQCDKGISIFNGEVWVRRCLIADNDKGISAKSQENNSATVHVDHVTFAGNRWSIEARLKSNAPSPENYYHIRNSIIRHNSAAGPPGDCPIDEGNEDIGGRTIRTDFDISYIEIHYSNLQNGFQLEGEFHETWPGPGTNNITADPVFADSAEHDFHLQAGSPCIDAGDPASPLDPDGTPADMGAFHYPQATGGPRFRRGEVNGDGEHDISDAVTLLLHLFVASAELSCLDSGDANDDGFMDVSDPIYLLDYLLTGGAAPPPPFPGCGVDPTADEIGCEREVCP